MKYAIPFLITIFLPTLAVQAAANAAIGQIQAGGASADDEFIAIQNPSAQNVDIGSWSIQYKSAKGTSFYKKNLVKGMSIAPGGTFIICGKDFSGACDMKHSSFSLSSEGGTVFIVSNQALIGSADDPAIVDQKTYDPEATETKPPQNENEASSQTEPMAKSKRTDTTFLSINEFMPSPTEGDEWIEIYNGNNAAIDLSGWALADGTGKNFLTLSGLIMPASFRTFGLSADRLNNGGDAIILRDAEGRESDRACYGDWQCDGAPAPTGKEGISVARIGDGRDTNDDRSDFALTATPTPGAANVINVPEGAKEQITTTSAIGGSASGGKLQKNSKTELQWLADLLDKKNSELADLLKAENVIIVNNLYIGTDVSAKGPALSSDKQEPSSKPESKTTAAMAKTTNTKTSSSSAKTTPTVSGQVIVPAGIVGADICVVREENRSVEVRLPKGLAKKPSAGDAIKASGSWSTAKTLAMPRLLVKTATAFSVTGYDDPPSPADISLASIEEHVGEIISTQGTVVEKQSTRLRIADGEASLVVKTKFSAAKGDRLAVTGLLTSDAADKYLTPIDPSGISLIKPPPEPAKSAAHKILPYGLAAVPAVILSTAAYFGKKIKKKKDKD